MPTDSDRLPEKLLREILVGQEIETLSVTDLLAYFMKETPQNRTPPSFRFSVDPRSRESIIYNPARAKRPHNYSDESIKKKTRRDSCPICAGETTGIIDLAQLSDGYTFINKNLFPVIQPPALSRSDQAADRNPLWGFHLVQWSSSVHDQDWHNMAEEDCVIVMSRLAAVENKLLCVAREIKEKLLPGREQSGDGPYISLIKNAGSAVGGSIEHGHQQVLVSNLAPRRFLENQKFELENGTTFSEHLQVSNPNELLLRDYGGAVLFVSKYMRRPLEMVLALKDTKKSYLHQLDESELLAVSRGWMDGTHVIRKLMPDYGKEIAYNIVAHNGPGAGLYFEFLPYTQEQGGFEQLGLAVCQADPLRTAEQIRVVLEG